VYFSRLGLRRRFARQQGQKGDNEVAWRVGTHLVTNHEPKGKAANAQPKYFTEAPSCEGDDTVRFTGGNSADNEAHVM